jgi:hypothetical protein
MVKGHTTSQRVGSPQTNAIEKEINKGTSERSTIVKYSNTTGAQYCSKALFTDIFSPLPD